MSAISMTQASEQTLRAYHEFAGCGEMAQTILTDLESQIPGDFCPENQYVTAYNLGQIRVLQMIAVRMAEAQTNQPEYPQEVTDGTSSAGDTK